MRTSDTRKPSSLDHERPSAMAVEWSPLTTAFVDDHQQLTRALKQLKDALGRHDLSEAKRIAEELDCAAGPHILFEEAFLYPEVARARGRDYIERLYEEHRAGRDLLTRILVLRSDSRRRLGDEEQARLLQQAEMTLGHAVSCGTLLSYPMFGVTRRNPLRHKGRIFN